MAFGKLFIANPDLPRRFATGAAGACRMSVTVPI
jgi:2,4-dienoyl-CoA reductase-like NADH-dependent reductase (Old Yellow Enzyme family)